MGSLELKWDAENSTAAVEDFEEMLPADHLQVRGLSWRIRKPGIGTPLVGVRRLDPEHGVHRCSPVTAVLRPPQSLHEMEAGRGRATLELRSALRKHPGNPHRTMHTRALLSFSRLLGVLTALLLAHAPTTPAQNVTDEIEVVRGVLKADRTVLVVEAMQLGETESNAFWPPYRDHRADMDRIGDGLARLILEYPDLYPAVPEDRAPRT